MFAKLKFSQNFFIFFINWRKSRGANVVFGLGRKCLGRKWRGRKCRGAKVGSAKVGAQMSFLAGGANVGGAKVGGANVGSANVGTPWKSTATSQQQPSIHPHLLSSLSPFIGWGHYPLVGRPSPFPMDKPCQSSMPQKVAGLLTKPDNTDWGGNSWKRTPIWYACSIVVGAWLSHFSRDSFRERRAFNLSIPFHEKMSIY